MTDNAKRTLYRWFTAEVEEHDQEAQAALHELFRQLPRSRPSAGFADQVLMAAGVIEQPRPVRTRWFEWLAASVLLLTLSGALMLAWIGPIELQTWVAAAVQGALVTSEWLGHLGSVVEVLGHLREALVAVASTPQAVLCSLLLLTLSALALGGLASLTRRERGTTYA